MSSTAPILVLHAVADAASGRPWRDALTDAGWGGPVLAPDLPGHAGTPPPTGGHHELADPVIHVLPLLAELGDASRPVVVGVGANGWSAQLLAIGGRAARLVVVDGLGSPWRTPEELVTADLAELRAIGADPAALATAPGDGSLDPRLRHGPRAHGSRALAVRAAGATPVPTLVIETPASATPPPDRVELARLHPAGAQVVEIPTATPGEVVAAVIAWMGEADRRG